jgi:hypothetical protein
MANEIQAAGNHGDIAYAILRNVNAQVWSTSGASGGAFGTYLTPSYSAYPITLAEQGTASAYYTGSVPAAVPPGILNIEVKKQVSVSPAETDIRIALGTEYWDGSTLVSLSSLATSGQLSQFLPIRPAKGQMITNFPIYLKSSVDHITPFTSGALGLSGQISKDGGNFGPLQSGTFTEVGQGVYNLQALTSGDLNCNTATLRFSATGISGGQSDPLVMSILLQRGSGLG